MDTQDRNRAKIAKALTYIENNLSAPLRISDITEHTHLSPFHFQRLFHAYMGESTHHYISGRRLEAAALRLRERTDVNLLQLALDCGYQTHSAFSKAFKKQFGVSPTTFRKNPDCARTGHDEGRQFLINSPSSQAIEPVDRVQLPSFNFQFRVSLGTSDGRFFQDDGRDIGQEFTTLRTQNCAPDLFLMSCFPNSPQSLNDETVPAWFGGAFSRRTDNEWSQNWRAFRAGQWAVFEHWGEYAFLYQTWNQIYRNWLPQTAFILRDEMPFEAYLAPSKTPHPSKQLTQIYIPVKKA